MRRVVDTLWPGGPIWQLKPGGHFDNFVKGMSQNFQDVQEFLGFLADIRNPRKTTLLSDLEKEYGEVSDENLSDEERRNRLAEIVYAPDSGGDEDFLEGRLRGAGFDVHVHANDPPIDPNLFLDQLISFQCGEPDVQCGEPLVQAGTDSPELIVAGDIPRNIFVFTSQSGINNIQSGVAGVQSGSSFFDLSPIEYPDPNDPDRWPFVFFVGGDSIRNIFLDGDMERVDTKFYAELNNAVLTKVTGSVFGTYALSVAGALGNPGLPAAQTALQFPDGMTTFDLTGFSRGDGAAKPLAYQSDTAGVLGNVVHVGGVSTSWGAISETLNVADGKYIALAGDLVDADVGFDNMEVLATNAQRGEIQSIDYAQVPFARRDEFLRSILKWKPERSWGVAIVEYT